MAAVSWVPVTGLVLAAADFQNSLAARGPAVAAPAALEAAVVLPNLLPEAVVVIAAVPVLSPLAKWVIRAAVAVAHLTRARTRSCSPACGVRARVSPRWLGSLADFPLLLQRWGLPTWQRCKLASPPFARNSGSWCGPNVPAGDKSRFFDPPPAGMMPGLCPC